VLGVLNNFLGLVPAPETPPDQLPGLLVDLNRTVAMFAISFAAIFFFLLISSLKLPATYGLVIFLVVAALCLVATAYLMTPVSTDLLNAAGYVAWAFAAVGAWIFLAISLVALGGRPVPLGPIPWPNRAPTA
jgi:hypothetical protein